MLTMARTKGTMVPGPVEAQSAKLSCTESIDASRSTENRPMPTPAPRPTPQVQRSVSGTQPAENRV